MGIPRRLTAPSPANAYGLNAAGPLGLGWKGPWERDGVGKIGTHISFLRGRLIADARRLGHFTAACSIPGWKPLAGTIDIANHML